MPKTKNKVNKIPRILVIRQSHWNVILTRTLLYQGEQELLGLCDPSTRCIYINKKQSERQQRITFLHEVLHALEFEYEFKLTHKVIELIEGPLGDFIRDNCCFI